MSTAVTGRTVAAVHHHHQITKLSHSINAIGPTGRTVAAVVSTINGSSQAAPDAGHLTNRSSSG
jgi:hypothetical protein